MAWARWLLPVPGGPSRSASSRWATKRAVASSKTRARWATEGAVDLLVEGEVEAVERAVGVAEAGLLVSSGEQAVLAALELVGDERSDEVERCHLLDLSLLQARFEDVGHAGEAQLAQRLVEFDEIHDGSPVLRSMRSR